MSGVAQKKRPNVVRLRVTDEELRFLQVAAERDDRSVSAVLRLALKQYAERQAAP